jgi:hypothetical protein
MYSILHRLLADKKGGEIFELFGPWHFVYVGLTVLAIILVLLLRKDKNSQVKIKTANYFVNVAFGLYILDFFLMPFAYGEIDIEKLPFHGCTAMCVLCFLSCRIPVLKKYRISFTTLGLISNLAYLVCPAGVMWCQVHPLSYRVIQTLLFHSVMTVYGVLTLLYADDGNLRNHWRTDFAVTVGMTAWAMLGSYAYSGTGGNYSRTINWFFVLRDPFNLLPEPASRFIMPFLLIALFFAAECILHLFFGCWKRKKIAL